MQITSDELPRHLKNGLKPLYVIHGDAPLLAIEAADSIRAAARAAGYSERETIVVEQHFKWGELRNAASSMSLFSSRKIVDIRIPSGKPGIEGGQALQDYAANTNDDVLTLISLPKLDYKTGLKSKWFEALAQYGIVISADDVPRTALPPWIAGRMQRQGQSAQTDTLEFLADRCEGNLLAAYQEIQKLALIYPAGELSFEQVNEAVMDVARYDISKLSIAFLTGDLARFTRILDGLRAEGTSTVLVLWALSEELRSLGKVLHSVKRGNPLNNAIRDARIWGPRLKHIEHAARRFDLPQIERGLQLAGRIDRSIKGLRKSDVWDELLQLGMRFAHR
jgi:DNA polymerase-3 subunit delta